ncbi:MAG: type IV secretory system conjugative DNA transfer family protein [Clostridia bacterium]|nr:type IV secretory system conjugative DNA transfer family protein [Clostridia bacterium]
MDLRSMVMQEHVEDNMPNAKMVDYRDPESDMKFYSTEQLKEVSGDWFPLSCHINEEGEAIYGGRSGVIHTYVQGDTGSGKTTRLCMQAIRALACTKDKPSLLITDIHGEIIETLYDHLVSNGYNVKIINCDDPARSHTYNPFLTIARDVYETGEISMVDASAMQRIVDVLVPIESTKDPIWERGARSYTAGLVLDKLEDIRDGYMTPDKLTLYSVLQNHHWMREKVDHSTYGFKLKDVPHFAQKGFTSRAIQKLKAVVGSPEKTRDSYFSVTEVCFEKIGSSGFFALSSNSTVDVMEFIEKPTAIIIQSGVTDSADFIVSLLVNDIYQSILKVGKRSVDKRAPRKVHCFIDEFANCSIADGPDFVKMLTTSRKFGMYWHMMIQCDAQLDRKFDAEIGRIIRANCSEIFLSSNDVATRQRFSQACGQKTVESLASKTSETHPLSLDVVSLITAEMLNLTEPGTMYVRASRRHLMKTYIEALYNCSEYEVRGDISSIYPHNTFDPKTTVEYPKDHSDEKPRSNIKTADTGNKNTPRRQTW